MTKILFTDMDGTLLKDDATISDFTRETLYKMTEAGHKLVLSSGRALPNIIQTKEKLGLNMKGVYISATNGTLIYECDTQKVIFESRLNMDDLKNVWPLASKHNIHLQTYSDTELIVRKRDRECDYYMIKCPLDLVETDTPWEYLKKPPVKMLAIDLDDKPRLEAFGNMISTMYPNITTVFSSEYYLEFFNCNAGKGNSLIWLCNYLNIDINNSYAAGDAGNDISMLMAAKNALAMCNSDPKLFEFATEISEFNNNCDGLAQYIVKKII